MNFKQQDYITLISIFALLIFIDEVFVRVFSILGLIIWMVSHYYEQRLVKNMSNNETLIYCEWNQKINGTDFLATEESTIRSLSETGENLTSAINKEFLFHSENDNGDDVYFLGKIILTDNKTIIRANNKNDLLQNT